MPIASSNPVPFLAIVPALFPPEKFWHGCPLRRPLYSEAGRLSPRCAESLRVDRPERAGKRQQALVSFPLPPLRKINDGSCVRATALCCVSHYGTRPDPTRTESAFGPLGFAPCFSGFPSSFIFFGARVASPSALGCSETQAFPGCREAPATETAGCA